MPRASKETASRSSEGPGFEARYEAFEGGYTVGFETFAEDADLTPLLKGLPDDRCHSPHWGYVLKGTLTYVGDREESFAAGDAFYVAAGHTLSAEAGTEVVFFSPTREWEEVVEAVQRNREAVGTARAGAAIG